jgi:hypothetical protein
MTKEEMHEHQQLCDGIINKYYDVQITTRPEVNQFSIHTLLYLPKKVYKHLKLVNINGMGAGQVHFIADDGSYVLVPWCYIISMLPAKECNNETQSN